MPTESDPMMDFANELLKKAGIDNLPEEFKKQQLEQLAFEAQRRLALVAQKEMSAEALDQYFTMVEKDKAKPERLLEFFKANVDNFEAKMQEALREFGDEFLGGAAKLQDMDIEE